MPCKLVITASCFFLHTLAFPHSFFFFKFFYLFITALGLHAKAGTIKDRNGINLTEAEDIKKRWQEYTEELYKRDLHDPDNHDGVITHLEPDILECESKWALGSITMNKAMEVMEFQLSYFKS